MGLTIEIKNTDTITPASPYLDTSFTFNYAVCSVASGRQALDIDFGASRQDQKRYRPAGSDGSYLIRCGDMGRVIKMRARYMADTLNLAMAPYVSDFDLYGRHAVTITTMGQVFAGCNIMPESVAQTAPIRGTGRLVGQVYFDVRMAFVEDRA